ncbi:MAG: glycosyltransferase family 4 protein, partial [Microcystaceae cyanobacterium]
MANPLKICVDATSVRGQLSGVGFYTLSLIQALQTLQETENYNLQVYFQPGMKNWLQRNFTPSCHLQKFANPYCLPLPVTLTNLLINFPNPILSALESRLNKPDIVHGTDHFVFPCRHSQNIMTIHDLAFIKYPQYVPKIVTTYRDRIQKSLKYTDAVITMAENTKQDILQYFPISPEKIHVIPLASRYLPNFLNNQTSHPYQEAFGGIKTDTQKASPPYQEAFGGIKTDTQKASPPYQGGFRGINPEHIESLKTQTDYDFKKPYFLLVSTLEPRKNVITLIEAFNQFKQTYKSEHQLVLIGQLGWKYEAILTKIRESPYAVEIHHLSYLTDELLILFYTLAEAFVYPSFYEGFGLPVLEAMTLGC